MKIKGSICESGGKKATDGRLINEDGFLTFDVNYKNGEYNFAILMDGATGLGNAYEIIPGCTPAEWYVKFMMKEMQKVLIDNPDSPLITVVDECILRTISEINAYEKTKNIKLEEYQKPSAGLCLTRNNGNTTDVYLIGDIQALIAYKNGDVLQVDNPNKKALQKLDGVVLKKMAALAKERNCDVLETRTDMEIEAMLQENRSKKNTELDGSYWVCGTTLKSAEHGVCVAFDNDEIEGIIISSDGFDYSMLKLNDWEVYNLTKEIGVSEVAKKIRKQQNEDPMCNMFPRFKKSDDLTALYFEY